MADDLGGLEVLVRRGIHGSQAAEEVTPLLGTACSTPMPRQPCGPTKRLFAMRTSGGSIINMGSVEGVWLWGNAVYAARVAR
jgi:hypothetical protein